MNYHFIYRNTNIRRKATVSLKRWYSTLYTNISCSKLIELNRSYSRCNFFFNSNKTEEAILALAVIRSISLADLYVIIFYQLHLKEKQK
jgi:hypothetical protein